MCIDPISIGAGITALAATAAEAATAAGGAIAATASSLGGASMLGTALSIGSSVAGFAAQQQSTDAYNQAVLNNAAVANRAAQYKYEDAQRKYIYDSTAVNKEGYDAALRGRAARATGLAQSADSGFTGVSLDNLLAAEDQKAAENQFRVSAKRDDLTQNYTNSTKGYEMEATGRAASMSMRTGPSSLGLALNIGGDLAKNDKVKSWLNS